MPRSIAFIKSVHTVIFFFLSACIGTVLYSAISGQITLATWVAFGLLLAEGVVLAMSGWRCPLTTYAERLGVLHGSVTDIFLPKWFADRVFTIGSGVLVFSTVLLVVRMLA